MSNPKIQLRHDTVENWSTANPVLLDGEVGIEKGGAFRFNIDNTSTGTYTLTNNIITNCTPELEKDIGFTTLESNKQLSMEFRIKLPTTPNSEYQDVYRAGDYSGSNDSFFVRFRYDNGTYYIQEGIIANGNFEILECGIPSNGVNVWIDMKVEARFDGSLTIYRYIGIRLAGEENYNRLSDQNINNVYSIGTTNKPMSFFGGLVGEANLEYCTINYDNSNIWNGLTTGALTKLKIGDGETAWNDLPYII